MGRVRADFQLIHLLHRNSSKPFSYVICKKVGEKRKRQCRITSAAFFIGVCTGMQIMLQHHYAHNTQYTPNTNSRNMYLSLSKLFADFNAGCVALLAHKNHMSACFSNFSFLRLPKPSLYFDHSPFWIYFDLNSRARELISSAFTKKRKKWKLLEFVNKCEINSNYLAKLSSVT